MNAREDILALFSKKVPKRIPFLPFGELVPKGSFEREMRNRGMGLIPYNQAIWSEIQNVVTENLIENGSRKTIYHTPKGDVYEVFGIHLGRIENSGTIQMEYLIKDEKDFEPVIYMIENTSYSLDQTSIDFCKTELGDDGILRYYLEEPPYVASVYYFGLEAWSYAQFDYPEEFERLIAALDKRQDRYMKLVCECKGYDMITLGNLAGNFGPQKFEKYVVPYCKKYLPMLKNAGNICSIHADAINLEGFKHLLPEMGFDMIEAFTPPPVGNLSLSDARKVWGNEVIIMINFPETVFFEGYDYVKQFTLDLLRSDSSHNSFISFTEMGLMSVNSKNKDMFYTGTRAIMDAIDEIL
ncbi:MAG TPA: hypothetical protein VIK78_18070 [Ruminiclostridium sp.]